MKNYLSSAPLLAKPEYGEPFFLYLVVSKNTSSAIMVKEQDGDQYLLYYVCKSLPSMLQQNYIIIFEAYPICVKTNYDIMNVMRKPEMLGRMAISYINLSTYGLRY